MTLDSALRLLRDKQNDVKLNIPISGNINDPQFSIADAINQVLAKTLQTATVSALKYMLGPYGIGISVAQLAYEQAIKIRLNPIRFAPGSAELDEVANDYLQRVAAVMKKYPAAQVSVCGVATESDREAASKNTSTKASRRPKAPSGDNVDNDKILSQKEPASPKITDATLVKLAKSRSEGIEDQLVKIHGIAGNRIIDCTPEIDSSAAAEPRANLEI
jgi:outer membrane protein OmpA-like peptidoglycan-associated protein